MHEIQRKLLDFLQVNNSEALGYNEIGRAIGIDHPQKIKHHLQQLEKKGYIRREEKNQTFILLKDPISDIVFLPLYGLAKCGQRDLNDDGSVDKFPVSTRLFNIKTPNEFFLVKAEGDSMLPTIKDGDLVIVRKQPAVDFAGQTALVVHQGTARIKNVIWKSDLNYGLLISTNPEYKPMEFTVDDQFLIHGVVKHVVSNY